VPQPPIGHELNLATQAVLLYGSWIATVVVLLISVRMGIRQRTIFHPSLVVAVLVGAFVEPLYDSAMMLYFYSTKGMVTHFTAFGIPQPLWTHSGYAVLYAIPALVITQDAWRGTLTSRRLYTFACLEFLMSCAFEMIGINGGAYTYWGPHTFRVLQYPLIIGILETAQVVVFAIAAAALRRRATRPVDLLGLLVLFPCTFLGANFGAGWPTIIAIHLAAPTAPTVVMGTLLSTLLALLLIRAAAGLIPVLASDDSSTANRATAVPVT
jgi:hypothetical protein